jgi:FtsZ-binding cell division protein ZapB
MDVASLITVCGLLATTAGGYFGGRRTGNGAVTTALETVQLIQAQVAMLTEQNLGKSSEISQLQGKVEILEGLVTQRADVGAVKEVVDRIAAKVGA